ncbi:MAG: hemerythrin family protein [Treponema sp.]|jgi:hemerythrin|nr:hemerythrin family protein [Treponema sp.]
MSKDEKTSSVWFSSLHHNVLIIWQPEYDLGIPIVDEQHRGIVSTINSLYYGMQHKHGENLLRPVIGMVDDYTRIHFEIEEDFLKKCGFPGLKRHHDLHSELSESLTKVGKKSLFDQDPQGFLNFLKKWWNDHILDEDRAFRDYLKRLHQ